MKARIIAGADGRIKAFSILPKSYDRVVHGEIFPMTGDVAHDLEIPADLRDMFMRTPHHVYRTLYIKTTGSVGEVARK